MIEWLLGVENKMQTQINTYCVIGDPIQHSLSPAMHNAAFSSLGLNSTYIAFRVPKEELEQSIHSLRSINIAGFNVTSPHKIGIINYMNELDLSVEKAQAVNTVHNLQGTFKAYNTDVQGFIGPLHKRKINFNGMTILLLGAGGAARAVIAALSSENGICEIKIVNRHQISAKELAKMGSNIGLKCNTIDMYDTRVAAAQSHLIINTIPFGTNTLQSTISYKNISKDSIVYDIVYKPVVTDLIENAQSAGAHVIYGYEMLLEQGVMSFEIWTGRPAPRDIMKKALFGSFGEPK
jgi:shikimate dehydrogenase